MCVSVNGLRHSFAKSRLESGTYIRYIQELPDYKNSKTTKIYTYIAIFSDTN